MLDKHATSRYTTGVFLFSIALVVAILWINQRIVNRHKAELQAREAERPLMALYRCDTCETDFVLPYTEAALVCPNCGPLFQELADLG